MVLFVLMVRGVLCLVCGAVCLCGVCCCELFCVLCVLVVCVVCCDLKLL